jgi:putative transcriptional regulator
MKVMYCRLAVLMAEKNPKLTQRGLAREIGLGVSTVQRLYNNDFARVDKATIESLCDYFGCGIGDLFVLREKKS